MIAQVIRLSGKIAKAAVVVAVIGYILLHLLGNSLINQSGMQALDIKASAMISLGFAASFLVILYSSRSAGPAGKKG